MSDTDRLADVEKIREFFGMCDCDAASEGEHRSFQAEWDAANAALARLAASDGTGRERRYAEDRAGILASAVGMARLHLADGNADEAKRVLDEASDKTSALLAAALAEGEPASPLKAAEEPDAWTRCCHAVLRL